MLSTQGRDTYVEAKTVARRTSPVSVNSVRRCTAGGSVSCCTWPLLCSAPVSPSAGSAQPKHDQRRSSCAPKARVPQTIRVKF